MAKFTFIDLFAGCGGLSEGFLTTGKFKSLAHVEWEMPMVESLRNRLVKKWGYSELEAKRDVIHFDIQKTDELLNGNWSEDTIGLYGSTNDSDICLSGLKGDYTEPHPNQPPVSRQFKNRLYDRDTLLLSHYDVNFLFVLALYARNNAGAKAAWRHSVRDKFRRAVQDMLKEKFEFYALAAHPDVNASDYFKSHFQDTLGKTFRPYENQNLFSLALDKSYPEDNNQLLSSLGKNFYVVPIDLGEDPSDLLETERAAKGPVESPNGIGKFLTCLVRKEETGEDGRKNIAKLYQLFYNHEAEGATYVMLNMPGGDISEAKYLLPLIDNSIDGYYDIERISFGTRTKVTKDGQSIPNYPTLRIKIGSYHPLDRNCTEGIVPHMANQIWSYAQLQNVIAKSQSYFYEKNDEKLIAQEPEVQYEYHQVENDYIDESFDPVNKNTKNAE